MRPGPGPGPRPLVLLCVQCNNLETLSQIRSTHLVLYLAIRGRAKWVGPKHDEIGPARKIVGRAGPRPTPSHA
jgi:hypothetical protein